MRFFGLPAVVLVGVVLLHHAEVCSCHERRLAARSDSLAKSQAHATGASSTEPIFPEQSLTDRWRHLFAHFQRRFPVVSVESVLHLAGMSHAHNSATRHVRSEIAQQRR